MRRIDLPIVSVVVTTILMTLIVIPVVYFISHAKQFRKVN